MRTNLMWQINHK